MTPDSRARWAELLSLGPDATADAALAAFLRALPGADFAPPAARVAAVGALAGVVPPVGTDHAVERLLADEAEAFAARYWELEPGARLVAWSDLSRRATGGRVAARLLALEPALDVSAAPLADPAAEELAALFRALFVLPPLDRAIRRNAWLTEHAGAADRWRAALAAVRGAAPGVAALDAQLATALGPDFDLAALPAGTATGRSSVAADVAGFTARMREYEAGQDYDPGFTPEHERADAWRAKQILAWSAALAFATVVAVCAASGISNLSPRSREAPAVAPGSDAVRYTPPVYTPPTYTPPAYTPPTLRLPAHDFTAAQVAEFERYERERTSKWAPAPPKYDAWILAGRPRVTEHEAEPVRLGMGLPLDALEIRQLQEYDRTRSGAKPPRYDVWVKLGKPARPGYYSLPETNP